MDTDLQVLRHRIERLEALLGSPGPNHSGCIHVRTKDAQEKLRAYVPDEMAAARRAIALLSYAAPSMSSLGQVRKARAARAEGLVDRAATALRDLATLQESEQLDASMLVVAPELSRQLEGLQESLSGEIAQSVQEEEQALEQLLIDFNRATALLNGRILALANDVRVPAEGQSNELDQKDVHG